MINCNRLSGFFCAVALILGASAGGYFIGQSIRYFKDSDRIVVVKGLSERIVNADKAELTLSFKGSGDDLMTLQKKMMEDQEKVLGYLRKEGFKEDDFQFDAQRVTDKKIREYGDPMKEKEDRFIVENSLRIFSDNLEKIKSAFMNSTSLLEQGIILVGNLNYIYTQFDRIKLEMLEDSIKNAREAAEKFSQDSGAKITGIKWANQGVFDIMHPDTIEGNYQSHYSSIRKKIRVVTTVHFLLADR